MKYLSFIFLTIWILIFPIIGGVISYETNEKNYSLISIISIIAIFNLVWFCLRIKSTKMDFISKIGNLLILNLPAFFTIKAFFKKNFENQNKKLLFDNKYKKNTSIDDSNDDFDIIYTEEEQKILESRANKKNFLAEKKKLETDDENTIYQRKLIRGFGVYILYQIYLSNDQITNTYQIIQEYQKIINDDDKRLILISNFVMPQTGKEFVSDFNDKKDNYEILSKTPKEEFIVALRQDRVDMQIEAKKKIN